MARKYIFYFIFLLFLSFCSKQAEITEGTDYDDEETVASSLQPAESEEKVEEKEKDSEDDGYEEASNNDGKSLSVAKVRSFFKREQYQKVLDYVQNYSGADSLYYSGVAYFNLYLQAESYSSEDRNKFLKNCQNNLSEAFEKAESNDVKEKALFQLGVVHHLKSEKAESQNKAIRFFQRIREEVGNGYYQADSIWAEAYVKVKMFKKRSEAKKLLSQLNMVRDPYIYNFVDKIYYSTDGKKAVNRIIKQN